MGKSVESLSPRERAAYYRGMAAEALQLAVTASHPETRAAFVDSASSWLSLAVEIESIYLAGHAQPRRNGARRPIRSGIYPRPH